MKKPLIVTVIGSFPQPIHGASVINQSLFEFFLAQGLNTSRIDLSPGRIRWWGYHLTRAVRAIAGFFTILFAPSGATCRYVMSVDGGAGLFYNAMLAFAVRLRKQALLLYHHSSNYVLADSMLMRLLLRASGKGAGHVMCSAQMFSKFRQRYGASAPAIVVNNAAWVPSPHGQPSVHAGPIRLGHLSGLTEEKGLGRAIETLRELRRRGIPAELTLAGPVQDEAAQQTISHAQKEFGNLLHWIGEAKGKNKALFYEGIDYFLFPSLYRHETQSLVVPEALAETVPVIAYDHRYVGEVVGEGGLLIPVGSPFALQAADWIVSGNLQERRTAARRQFDKLRHEVSSQLDLLLDWARAANPRVQT
jgi:glycosyltransferase involved in cell wall biosynthesis